MTIPLYGERSLPALAKYIDRSMPDEAPEKCSARSRSVSRVYLSRLLFGRGAGSEQSAEARAARLTNRQFRESVADLIGSFRPQTPPAEGEGLRGEYYESKGMNKKQKRAFERVDKGDGFRFRRGQPG
jgi:hypothetical protein